MPKVGDEEFAYTPEGIAKAKAKSEETGVPMSNAMERSETYQMGGVVPEYEEGGEVKKEKDITDVVKKVEHAKKMERKYKKSMAEGTYTGVGYGDPKGRMIRGRKRASRTARDIINKSDMDKYGKDE